MTNEICNIRSGFQCQSEPLQTLPSVALRTLLIAIGTLAILVGTFSYFSLHVPYWSSLNTSYACALTGSGALLVMLGIAFQCVKANSETKSLITNDTPIEIPLKREIKVPPPKLDDPLTPKTKSKDLPNVDPLNPSSTLGGSSKPVDQVPLNKRCLDLAKQKANKAEGIEKLDAWLNVISAEAKFDIEEAKKNADSLQSFDYRTAAWIAIYKVDSRVEHLNKAKEYAAKIDDPLDRTKKFIEIARMSPSKESLDVARYQASLIPSEKEDEKNLQLTKIVGIEASIDEKNASQKIPGFKLSFWRARVWIEIFYIKKEKRFLENAKNEIKKLTHPDYVIPKAAVYFMLGKEYLKFDINKAKECFKNIKDINYAALASIEIAQVEPRNENLILAKTKVKDFEDAQSKKNKKSEKGLDVFDREFENIKPAIEQVNLFVSPRKRKTEIWNKEVNLLKLKIFAIEAKRDLTKASSNILKDQSGACWLEIVKLQLSEDILAAKESTKNIKSPEFLSPAWYSIVQAEVTAGKLENAEDDAKMITDRYYSSLAYATIAASQFKS